MRESAGGKAHPAFVIVLDGERGHEEDLRSDVFASRIQDAWLAFARSGNPSCESLGEWPIYGDRRVSMVLGEECGLAEAVLEEERRAWDSVPDAVIGWN